MSCPAKIKEFCTSDRAAYEKLSDDVPFELPKGWARIRIGDVFHLHAGKYISAKDIHNQCEEYSIPCFGGNGLRGYVAKANTHDIHAIIGRQGALCGCLNISDSDFYATEHAVVVDCYCGMTGEFAFHFLGALNLNRYATATAQPGLSVAVVNEVPFPLPPFNEQKKIVTCIEELFKAADSLGETADGLDAAAKRLDKKILDLAIRGKLVPQNPDDEPASELLKLIAATSHKSPCKNHETPIEPPFEIPKSWEWAKLGIISNYGQCRSVDAQSVSAETWSLDLEEIEKETGRLIVRKTAADKKSASSKHLFCKGMVLYSKLRTYLNKVLVADMDGVCTSEIVPISVATGIMPEFLRIVLMSPYFLQYTASKGYGVKMPRVGTNDMRESLIPIPPSAEQQRIVDRVQVLKHIVALLSAP